VILFSLLRVVLDELFDGGLDPGDLGEDLVGCRGPDERLGVGVPQVSIWLIHEDPTGVKWNVTFGLRSSHALTRIWIGPPDLTDQPYPTLDQLPEIVAAQRAHLRLLHRLGPAATYDAVLTGFLICGHRWDQQPDPTTDLDARHAWRTRIDILIPPGTEQTTFSTSRLFAATYPEAVKIAALVGSLHWRRQAAGDPDGQRRFAAEIGRRLGQPEYQPKVTKDPIAHWIDDDCWRPPSLPPTTYRTLPGFGNPTITKPNQHSLDRHHRSAHWFARNRRGGRVILYHRHVGSVLARDWSRKMEQFVGTVEASAETCAFREVHGRNATAADTTPELAADYIRPTAVKSDHLDNAASPAARRRPKATSSRALLDRPGPVNLARRERQQVETPLRRAT
jgi:hypothetical protein